MGTPYELLSTPIAYARKAWYPGSNPQAFRHKPAVTIPFGPDPLQHCVLWEPDHPTHDATVMYFHGGGYLVGTPESMLDAANVYNSRGYRFCSIGFRLMPRHRFPDQVDDAFAGINAARAWLAEHGRPTDRIIVGGSSCGGHLACLVGYGRDLCHEHGFDRQAVAAVISVAAVVDADDMLLRPFPNYTLWHSYVDLPRSGSELPNSQTANPHVAGLQRPNPHHNEQPARLNKSQRHEALMPFSPIAIVAQEIEGATNGQASAAGTYLPPFFAVHGRSDTMSPYEHEATFVHELSKATEAHLHTIDDPRWQHMMLTVTLHKNTVEKSPALQDLFGWLGNLGL